MDNTEILATEVAENVEPTTEEMGEQVEQIETPEPKTYTQEELDRIVGERLAREKVKNTRNEAKIRKEYENKYGPLENVLKAGTGKDNVEEVTSELTKFYEGRGIKIPTPPTYNARDIEVLAKAEAEDIIASGLEEVVEEVDRLAGIGVDKMNPREKALFRELAEYRKDAEASKELSKIGVTEDVYASKDFKEFASQFNSNTPVTKIYEIYNKMQPKKEVRTMGSMKTNTPPDNGVKDFYSYDEAVKFTKADFDKNPALYEAVKKSMTKW